MAEVADQLLRILKSLDQSSHFCVSGSADIVLPGLEVNGVGPVGMPVSPAVARQLIEQAAQAPYGRGEETIVDTEVRRVWQIEPKQFALRNAAWEKLIEGIIEKVKTEFGIKGHVKGSLYKLLIYEEGSFFAPHRDTEKVDGMFATLVVCLPSRHEGGTLIVSHDGHSKETDFGNEQGEFTVQYAAFYADCRHEIKPVTQGCRVCLVYNLALDKSKRQPAAPRNAEKGEQAAGLLPQIFADGTRNKIAIPLKHEYSEAGLSLDMLKGADRSRVDVLSRAAAQAKYHCYLALMTYRQTGDVDYDTVRYRRSSRWNDAMDVSSAEMGEVYDESLTLNHWIGAEGQQQSFGEMNLLEEEILSETAFEDFPFKQEVSEATGNEGATVERWYHKAVVVIWPPDRTFRILAGQGQASAIPVLEKMAAAAKDPSRDEDCRTFAREIIGQWKTRYGKDDSSGPAAMLKLLERIADPVLVQQFIHDVLPKNYRGTEGEALSRLAGRLGWEVFAERLTRFVALQLPDAVGANLPATAFIVAGLCRGSGEMNPERKKVCRAVASELERTVRQWDAYRDPNPWGRRGQVREGIIEALTQALAAVDEGALLEQFLAHTLADKEHYSLHPVLIPAVKSMDTLARTDPAVAKAQRQVGDHCIAELERLTETPLEEPKDWTQNITLRCTCADCRELQQFLRDPREKVHRFRAVAHRREHLEGQISSHGCDMSCVTERKGSPHTLVCTKNRASHEQKKGEFASNLRLLTELRGMVQLKRKK